VDVRINTYMKYSDIFETENYRGEHEAPDKIGGAPLYNVNLNNIYPEDFYSYNGFKYYADTGEASDRQSFYLVMSYYNKPNSLIKMYRAVPKDLGITKIKPGDWVAITRIYALGHGRNHLNSAYKIITKTVWARDLFTDGNSISEWGYDPQPRDTSFDEERHRRQKLVFSLPADQRKAFNQERKHYGNMTPEQWDKLFQSFSTQETTNDG
jgi:hypothetical protein